MFSNYISLCCRRWRNNTINFLKDVFLLPCFYKLKKGKKKKLVLVWLLKLANVSQGRREISSAYWVISQIKQIYWLELHIYQNCKAKRLLYVSGKLFACEPFGLGISDRSQIHFSDSTLFFYSVLHPRDYIVVTTTVNNNMQHIKILCTN